MKKIVVSIGILVFLFSGAFAGVVNVPVADEQASQPISREINFSFSDISTYESSGYEKIAIDGCSYTYRASYPSMPYKSEVLTFPLGTKIDGIDVSTGNINTMKLDGKIIPAAEPVRADMSNSKLIRKEGEIYQSNEPYPSKWVEWNVGAGIKNGEHVVFLSIHAFPARYIPAENELQYVNNMSIEIKYTPPSKPLLTNELYDLLIIAPSEFSDGLQPLVEHKNSHNVDTILVTLDEIYNGNYFSVQGRDDAEKIKYFIKDAIEQWGVKYVMLVGGRHGGVATEKWWCPVRYSNLDDGSDERQFLTDLYFSDIYKYDNGNATFEDWDSNGNGVFAEWKMMSKDMLDMYPDVYVGRLACRNSYEVQKMVEKIITYETTTKNQQWFKRFVGIAGDTYPDDSDPYYEGEIATEAAFNYLDGFEADYVWTSNGKLSGEDDIINAISQGAGFLHFSGHGNPMSWATHPPKDDSVWIGIDVTKFPKFSNDGMYPVCIVGGCHNSQFNVSVLNLLKLKNLKTIYYHSTWSPESWGWWMTRKFGGGSIATIANTGYGYGEPGEDCLEVRGRYMELQFFRSYAEGKDMLGETHASGLSYYMNKFPPMDDRIDCKIVQQWELLGDPSLKIGGY